MWQANQRVWRCAVFTIDGPLEGGGGGGTRVDSYLERNKKKKEKNLKTNWTGDDETSKGGHSLAFKKSRWFLGLTRGYTGTRLEQEKKKKKQKNGGGT